MLQSSHELLSGSERENLSERTKAGVGGHAMREHIGRPFWEMNWQKVDKYWAKGLSWSAVSISRVMD